MISRAMALANEMSEPCGSPQFNAHRQTCNDEKEKKK
jgi:hypothetical protein